MNQYQTLYQWIKEIARNMNDLSQPQAKNLAAFSLGIALAKQCKLRAVAEELYALGKPDSVERRLQRFLDNENVCWKQTSEALASWVIGSLMPLAENELIVLLVDETSLKDKLKVMAVSLAYHKRAIPLVWWAYPNDQWPMGQVELIKTLLQSVCKVIPNEYRCQVLVQADRGIGTSPELLEAIQELGFYYLVRVQRQVHLILPDGSESEVVFGDLVNKVGSKWSGKVYAFKKAGWLSCWAVGQWKAGHEEPWLLLTNFPKAEGNWYALRMWQEVAFKDFKSNGFNWQRSHVWIDDHCNRLWLAMAVAYLWVISMGSRVIYSKELRGELTRGTKERLSIFQLGLSFLKRWIKLERELCYDLWLISHLPISAL